MGQQQLLLVILVTIIVGIATVVAINVFGTAADEANRDAVRQDMLAAATQAQGLWARPTAMDGLGRSFEGFNDPRRLFSRGSDSEFTYSETTVQNENGTYTISGSGSDASSQLEITGEPASGGSDIEVTVQRVAGTGDDPDYWELVWEIED